MDTLKEAGRQAARSMKTHDGLDQVADAVTLATVNYIADEIAPYYSSASGLRMHLERLAVEFGVALSPPSGEKEPPKYSACRICGRGPTSKGNHEAIAKFGVHTDANGKPNQPNNGTAYCDQCEDETLVIQPHGSADRILGIFPPACADEIIAQAHPFGYGAFDAQGEEVNGDETEQIHTDEDRTSLLAALPGDIPPSVRPEGVPHGRLGRQECEGGPSGAQDDSGPQRIPSALEDIHDPHVVGYDAEDDVPLRLRRELLRVASHKSLSYYYLCAIYRQGWHDARRADGSTASAVYPETCGAVLTVFPHSACRQPKGHAGRCSRWAAHTPIDGVAGDFPPGCTDDIIAQAHLSSPSPGAVETPECVCEVDDSLVREWVQKAREVAKGKGFNLPPLRSGGSR